MHELGVCRNSGDDAIGETAKEGLAKFTQLDDAHKETSQTLVGIYDYANY